MTALAAVAALLLSVLTTAPADHANFTATPDQCASWREFITAPNTGTKHRAEHFLEAKGVTAYREPFHRLVKHYPYCSHPTGWLSVPYRYIKHRGWVYDVTDMVLVPHCWTAPGQPCDRRDLTDFEAALLNTMRGQR